MKECLYKLEKYLHKIKTVFQKTIKLTTDKNEIFAQSCRKRIPSDFSLKDS